MKQISLVGSLVQGVASIQVAADNSSDLDVGNVSKNRFTNENEPSIQSQAANESKEESSSNLFTLNSDGVLTFKNDPGDPVIESSRGSIPKQVGAYMIEKELGQGAFGIVYKGYSEDQENKKYAIKELTNIRKVTEKNMAVREAQILSGICHKHIIRYVETFSNKDTLYVVFEFANHGDLAQHIKKQKLTHNFFHKKEIADWFTQIVHGMTFLCDRNIMHRDLKPANIVLHVLPDSKGIIMKIADFGLAREIEGGRESASTHCGTRVYMSPEILNNERYTFKNDVWALGCILYEMCALVRPFVNTENVYAIRISDPDPNIVKNSINKWGDLKVLRTVCTQIFIRSPDKRPSCSELFTKMLKIKIEIESEAVHESSAVGLWRSLTKQNNFQVDYTDWFAAAASNDVSFLKSFAPITAVNVAMKNDEGQSALAIAQSNDHTEAVKFLTSLQPNLWEVLKWACKEDGLELVQGGVHDPPCNPKLLRVLGPDAIIEKCVESMPSNINETYEVDWHSRKSTGKKLKFGEWVTLLHVACVRNYVNSLFVILQFDRLDVNKGTGGGPRPFNSGSPGKTPLHYGCSCGHEPIVRLLLERSDLDVNKSCHYGFTPLFDVSGRGDDQMVRLLLTHPKIDVNKNCPVYQSDIMTDISIPPLSIASRQGNLHVVQLLLDRPDIQVNRIDSGDFLDPQYFRTPLYFAAAKGHHKVVRLLLDHSGKRTKLKSQTLVNGHRECSQTPLKIASANGHRKCVEVLLTHSDVDVNMAFAVDPPSGFAPPALHAACANGHTDVVLLLLAHPDVRIHQKDRYGRNAISFARTAPGCNVLQTIESNIRIRSEWFRRAAAGKLERNYLEWYLAQEGTNINSIDMHDETALYIASKNGHDLVVQLLLGQPNIDINGRRRRYFLCRDEGNGPTALHIGCEKGYDKVVRLLLSHHLINIQILAQSRHHLINYGRTPAGWVPIWGFRNEGHRKILKMLEDHTNQFLGTVTTK